jgi:hypothetical protein
MPRPAWPAPGTTRPASACSRSFGSTDYQQLLFALLVLALARVMQEAARVAAENEGFV